MSWNESLQSWDTFQITRWYELTDATEVQLHIFVDAFTFVYGALLLICIFKYFEGNDGKCSFIMSKSRLALSKERVLTISRLELQAAVVACRMENAILEEVTFKVKCVLLPV